MLPKDDKTERADLTGLPLPMWEFVTLMAALMSLTALATDVMLPALGDIRAAYALENPNDQQMVIFSFFLGFGVPQLFYGPISDARGRLGLMKICLIAYIITGFMCMYASSFGMLLAMRFLQGIAASGIRVITVSIVRDLVSGRIMARVMSLIMTIFMVVPILAPAFGQGITYLFSWQWTFGLLGVGGLIVLVWVHFRLPETLPAEKRRPLNLQEAFRAYKKVLTTRATFGYVCASGVIYGTLFAFISASEQVFDDVFGRGDRFAVLFAVIASVMAVGSYMNSRLVERYGMRRISHTVLVLFIMISLTNLLAMWLLGPNLIIFLALLALVFGCFGMLGANFSAIALEPLGEIAGSASAAYGFASITVAIGFGWAIARMFDGTVIPILSGYVALGVLSLIIVAITERGRLFDTGIKT